jgi:hypothetical protein
LKGVPKLSKLWLHGTHDTVVGRKELKQAVPGLAVRDF